MKRIFLILALLLKLSFLYSNTSINKNQESLIEKDSITVESLIPTTNDLYFNQAYDEIVNMLEKDSLDFKRAVFLIEWAYLGGDLDYTKFCTKIDSVTIKLKEFIYINNLQQYKTAGNFALFEYFTKPSLLNENRPFIYDFEDFVGDNDYKQIFVTKLMETHKGQCRSLPLYYKILSEELKTEAFLALAPHHLYIKHLDENNRWVNIELTNGHFSTDAYMISSMAISAEAIRNKIYLDALSMQESIAMLLTDLSQGYNKKYGYDSFTLKCCNKTLEYFPHYISALFIKFNTLQAIGLKYIDIYGHSPTPFIDANYKEFKDTQKTIEGFGYREITRENYEKWVKTMEDEKDNLLEK